MEMNILMRGMSKGVPGTELDWTDYLGPLGATLRRLLWSTAGLASLGAPLHWQVWEHPELAGWRHP